ncbi:hypothetical protein U1Q18_012192, partial [Sarracenia purpurea var. burkii]
MSKVVATKGEEDTRGDDKISPPLPSENIVAAGDKVANMPFDLAGANPKGEMGYRPGDARKERDKMPSPCAA